MIVKVIKNTYTAEPLYQWDLNQVLRVYGLSLARVPEVHFINQAMGRAIVRQARMDARGVVTVDVPNSLLQKPYTITAYICGYNGTTFETYHKLDIPVTKRPKPADYTLTNDQEVYSFNALENAVVNATQELATADQTVKSAEATLRQAAEDISNAVADEVAEQAVKKNGDTVKGDYTFRSDRPGSARLRIHDNKYDSEAVIYAGDNNINISSHNTPGDDRVRRALYLYNSDQKADIAACLRLLDETKDGLKWLDVLHTGNLEARGSCRIVSGEVTGSADAGEDSPNSITFPFKPKLVYVTCTSRDMSQSAPDMRFEHFLWVEGVTSDTITSSSYGSVYRRYKLDGNTLSWWVSDTAYSAAVVGRYVAIG